MKRQIVYAAGDPKSGMNAEEIQAAISDMIALGLDLKQYYMKARLTTWSASKIASVEFVQFEEKK